MDALADDDPRLPVDLADLRRPLRRRAARAGASGEPGRDMRSGRVVNATRPGLVRARSGWSPRSPGVGLGPGGRAGEAVAPDNHPDPVHIKDPDAPQGVRPLGVDPGFPHEVVGALPLGRAVLVRGDVVGRLELQVLPGVSGQRHVHRTGHVEVRVIRARSRTRRPSSRSGCSVRSGSPVRTPTDLRDGVQPAAAHEEQIGSTGWRELSTEGATTDFEP